MATAHRARRIPRRFAVAIGLLLAGAQAAPDTSADSEEILVKAQRLSPAQARARAIAYVQHTGVVVGKPMVARWIDKVCPRVVGLSPEHRQIVEARFRAVAAQVGAPLAAPGCTANVLIHFVGDGAAFARAAAAGDRRRLGDVSVAARQALLNGPAPIRWWYRDELRTRDGLRAINTDPPFVATEGVPGPTLPSNGADNVTMAQYSSSQVSTQIQRALTGATVVVDAPRSTGAPLAAVAAYAAYVALAEVTPPARPLAGSILGLFGTAPPAGLTRLDESFLRELYALPLDRRARQQRTRLVRALQKDRSGF
jgi:hypothetical protein